MVESPWASIGVNVPVLETKIKNVLDRITFCGFKSAPVIKKTILPDRYF